MPLFMCMSGYLYCKTKKEFSWKNYKKFALKKIINLAIPYITFYIVFISINMIFTNSVSNPKEIHDLVNMINSPETVYWFLYALLSIFIIIPILEHILKDNKNYTFIVLIVLKILSIFIKTNIYFIDSIMSYSIYFYLGSFINDKNRFQGKKNSFINIASIGTYFVFSVLFYKIKDNINFYISNLISIIFAIAAIFICVNVFRGGIKLKILTTFKKYTYQIYLLHIIFAAGTRIVLYKIGINNYWLHLIISLLISIYSPLIIAIISEKLKYPNFFFYPTKTLKELKERKQTQ